jgi:catechol 2,3-dioxygenase-like lactoylglutathione lyase family enzyme
MVKQLHTMIAEVADMAQANGFYRDTLGLKPEFESPHWSSYRLGSVALGLHPPFTGGQEGRGGGWVLGIETEDLRGMRTRLEGAGVACGAYHAVPGGIVMDFEDLDRNRLQAIQTGVTLEELSA